MGTDPAASRASVGATLRELRRRAAALARDAWGRGPERCEVHWAGPHLLVFVFHGGLTASERNRKEAGDLAEVAHSRESFRRAVEPQLQELAERLTGRAVQAALGTSRLDPDLTVEVFLMVQEAGREAAPTEQTAAPELGAATEAKHRAAEESEMASALAAQAAQAIRRAEAMRKVAREQRRRRSFREPPERS